MRYRKPQQALVNFHVAAFVNFLILLSSLMPFRQHSCAVLHFKTCQSTVVRCRQLSDSHSSFVIRSRQLNMHHRTLSSAVMRCRFLFALVSLRTRSSTIGAFSSSQLLSSIFVHCRQLSCVFVISFSVVNLCTRSSTIVRCRQSLYTVVNCRALSPSLILS